VERDGDVAAVTRVRCQPFDLLGELVDERVPPQLPVRDDVEAHALLHGERLVDGPVLDLLIRGRLQLAGLELLAGELQVRRAQQRPDGVRAVHVCHEWTFFRLPDSEFMACHLPGTAASGAPA
jgi:hypothetical protein